MTAPLLDSRWAGRLAGAAAIALAIGWVLWPALGGGWIWDDISEVTGNATLRNCAGLRHIWFAPPGPDYLPVKSTVQWLEWHLWGAAPAGFHWANAGFHFAGSLLVWRVLARLGVRFAFLGGLLFAIHPVAMESAAWISEQKNTLSLPLLLLATDAYLDFDSNPRAWPAYARAWALFVAAMLAKSSVVMFPAVLLLHAWWKRGKLTRRDFAVSAPFFAVSLLLGLVTVWFQQHVAIGSASIAFARPLARLASAGPIALFYLGKCALPIGLMPLYPPGIAAEPLLTQLVAWLALAGGLAWLGTKRRTWGRPILLGLGFILLNLAPVLGLIPMSFMRLAPVSDHLLYLSLVGAAGLAAAAAGQLFARLAPAARPGAAAALGAAIVALMLASRSLAAVYHDSDTLWAFAAAKNPGSAAAHFNLANARVLAGQLTEAVPEFAAAVQLQPDLAEARSNFGDALERLGRKSEAQTQYEAALRAQPALTLTRDKLGNLLLATGRLEDAIAQYEQAVARAPGSAAAQADLAYALARANRLDEAQDHYETALQLQPGVAENWDELGTVFALRGQLPEAIRHYERALQIDPGDAAARRNLALAQGMEQGAAR
jgi:tetratricopeptide (TPR) repeat protein